jgi:2-amino-4-hydroxy-6-hydroxymethyldihydropteridine diphosphokinase
VTAVVSVGSNLGDRLRNLGIGLGVLTAADAVTRWRVSPVYETSPVGGPTQGDFLNAVLLLETTLEPAALLELAHRAEETAQRVRTERWGPRTLDVDLIAVDDLRSDDPVLTLPHPRAAERAFVLAPWRDLEPDAELPGHGRVADLLAAADATGVVRRDDLVIEPVR